MKRVYIIYRINMMYLLIFILNYRTPLNYKQERGKVGNRSAIYSWCRL